MTALLAAIAFVSAAGNTGTTVASVAVTISPTANNTLVVSIYVGSSQTVSTVTDNAAGGSSTYTRQDGLSCSSGDDVEVYTTLAVKSGVTSVTITPTAAANLRVVVAQYSGVLQTGNHANATLGTCTTTSTSLSVPVTIQEANNFVAGGIISPAGNSTFTASAGTGREWCSTSACQTTSIASAKIIHIDNTSASTGAVNISATYGASGALLGAAVELCLSNPCATATGPSESGMRGFWGRVDQRPHARFLWKRSEEWLAQS